LSIGIIAWNEEQALGPMLTSLFQQSLFAELSRRGQSCEILCLANGCTDRTPDVAARCFAEQSSSHPFASAFSGRVVNIPERGKINAWNLFVHSRSDREAQFLFLMDADIRIHHRDTLWNMLSTLEQNSEADISVDQPCKDIEFKPRKTLRDRISLAVSRLTRSSEAQLCAQLYCVRSAVARNIYLPKDLTACDDGFIKTLVCTDFLAHPVWPMRIRMADHSSHTFEAYTTLKSIFKNQKRQVIGQTMVHILVDDYLKKLSSPQRAKLAHTIQSKERDDPQWLKQLVGDHVRRARFCWRLYPGLLTHPFQRLRRLNFVKQIFYLPVAAAGCAISLASSFAARRFLKAGDTNYWPRAERSGGKPVERREESIPPFARLKTHRE
jgi:glycosyltransferase involved in cell wall biosynthesis